MSPNNLIEKIEKLAMVLINIEAPDHVFPEKLINDQVHQAKNILQNNHSDIINDDLIKIVIRNIHSNLNVSMDKGTAIVDKNTKHKSWFPHRRAELDFFFWNRFTQYLKVEKKWNMEMVNTLDEITDDIIDLLGDPTITDPWQRRGLILGDVQSGKTINYTAISNKAVDAKYKVIILLTGTLENLRKQTQERLDSDFVGRDSKWILNKEIKNISIGVGGYGQKKRVNTFTSVKNDFSSNMLNTLGYGLKNSQEPVLFVVKKNKKILENLDTWLKVHNADDKGIIDLPMLLIDDEADNASVNTKSDDDPTAINEAIRKLLKRFSRSTYLGVTATPFANIFINPDSEDDMLGHDLFPKDFIYALSPPTSYIGSEAIFGEEAIYADRLEEIKDQVLPEKYDSHHEIGRLPESMVESIGYFILVNAIRDFRGDTAAHRSMLVNVTHLTAIQGRFSKKINEFLRKMRSDIQNFSKLDTSESIRNSTIKFLFNIWEKFNFEEISGTNWENIRINFLHAAASPIEVRTVNQKSGSRLNFNASSEKGLRIIAIGGYSLSRGLTLEGLVVSYFYRNSKMFDTLMQMGRWFGYRAGYEDLFRIWMKPDAIDWYRSITYSASELRDEIIKMKRFDKTPAEFGLKVRYDPETLLVTAKNKMKHTKTVESLISISGKLLETPRLPNNEAILKANYSAVLNLINKLDQIGYRDSSNKSNFWRSVPKEHVVELLENFSVDPSDLKFAFNHLSNYIESSNHLEEWDVYIPTGDGDPETKNISKDIEITKRARLIKIVSSTILVSGTKVRVGTGGDTKAGLTDEQMAFVQKEFKKTKPGKKNPSDNDYLIAGRKPLLILHVIQPRSEEGPLYISQVPLVAIGLGFPKFEDGVKNKLVKYVLNSVEIKNRLMFEEDDENEDD